MIITKQTLERLIDEEFDLAVKARRVTEATHALSNVDVNDLLGFAQRYSELDDLARRGLEQLLAGDDLEFDTLDPGTVDLIDDTIGSLHPTLDRAIKRFRRWHEDGSEALADKQWDRSHDDGDG